MVMDIMRERMTRLAIMGRIQGIKMRGMSKRHKIHLIHFITGIVAALAASNLLNQAPRANDPTRAMEAMKEFRRLNPPQFDGACSDLLVANHWLFEFCKLFTALPINEDDLRVSIMACQLIREANEWWELVFEGHRNARRAVRAAQNVNVSNVKNLIWAKFEVLFKDQ